MAIDRIMSWTLLVGLSLSACCAHRSGHVPDVTTADPRTYVEAGRKFLGESRLEEAADRFRAALALDSDDVTALEGLGLVALERGDWSEAEDYFRQGLARESAYAPLFVDLGRVAAARENNQEAIEYYLRAIAMEESLAEAHYRLGLMYERTGQFSLAEEYYKKTLDRDPNYSAAMESWRDLARRRSSPEDLPPEYISIVKKPVISRADLAAMLARQLPLERICDAKANLAGPADVPLSEDVPLPGDVSGHWASREISKVIACGLMAPFEDGAFRPRQAMSRRDFARIMGDILFRFEEEDWSGRRPIEPVIAPSDVPNEDSDLAAITLVTDLGIMELREDGSFRPDGEINGYAATRAVRALKEHLSP